MARIWRTTYEWPEDLDSYMKRGYRYAWIMHIYGRKFLNEEYPEAYLISEDFDERLLYTGVKSPRVTANCRAIDGRKSEKANSQRHVLLELRNHEKI